MQLLIDVMEGRWQFNKKADHRCNKASDHYNNFCAVAKFKIHFSNFIYSYTFAIVGVCIAMSVSHDNNNEQTSRLMRDMTVTL